MNDETDKFQYSSVNVIDTSSIQNTCNTLRISVPMSNCIEM